MGEGAKKARRKKGSGFQEKRGGANERKKSA